MAERFAVLGSRPLTGDRLLLILPNDESVLVAPGTTDAELLARYRLDRVVRLPPTGFCATINLDGPLSGRTGYGINELGHQVTQVLRPGPAAPTATYEVVTLSRDGRPAELRYIPSEQTGG
ncbi:hypothetical protein [Bailinhaonella thermotolerans]|uniref:Uncharacterized protein n=1 Tax=Bailinhaonella thermotolerans TaxID=1070861 RepID=A0A3A4B1V5_9ACTN|nr:hypothetical protein [Bailinhaonella thermotolerans]RJL32083.1 hypothetical protein D5H75_16800 [Bailinhaonella thermotolerans]